jgi:hypothetical protein
MKFTANTVFILKKAEIRNIGCQWGMSYMLPAVLRGSKYLWLMFCLFFTVFILTLWFITDVSG